MWGSVSNKIRWWGWILSQRSRDTTDILSAETANSYYYDSDSRHGQSVLLHKRGTSWGQSKFTTCIDLAQTDVALLCSKFNPTFRIKHLTPCYLLLIRSCNRFKESIRSCSLPDGIDSKLQFWYKLQATVRMTQGYSNLMVVTQLFSVILIVMTPQWSWDDCWSLDICWYHQHFRLNSDYDQRITHSHELVTWKAGCTSMSHIKYKQAREPTDGY